MARDLRRQRRGFWRGATQAFNPAGVRSGQPPRPATHPFHRDWANLGHDLRRAMTREDGHARRR